ncbi:hypothetical protein [Pseudarthrobacter sp. PvP090]|uniref:hypothetical protein n=1 Tax=Pseudarthrobacter sp. PvP090 TaxID=3156393 RepID=UPI0033965A33
MRISSVMPAIAPLATSHSRQSSVFVPTITSTCPPDPAAIRSIGTTGRTSPSRTGCHGIPLAMTARPRSKGP